MNVAAHTTADRRGELIVLGINVLTVAMQNKPLSRRGHLPTRAHQTRRVARSPKADSFAPVFGAREVGLLNCSGRSGLTADALP